MTRYQIIDSIVYYIQDNNLAIDDPLRKLLVEIRNQMKKDALLIEFLQDTLANSKKCLNVTYEEWFEKTGETNA